MSFNDWESGGLKHMVKGMYDTSDSPLVRGFMYSWFSYFAGW